MTIATAYRPSPLLGLLGLGVLAITFACSALAFATMNEWVALMPVPFCGALFVIAVRELLRMRAVRNP